MPARSPCGAHATRSSDDLLALAAGVGGAGGDDLGGCAVATNVDLNLGQTAARVVGRDGALLDLHHGGAQRPFGEEARGEALWEADGAVWAITRSGQAVTWWRLGAQPAGA